MKKRLPAGEAGTTLVELMVAIGVMGVILGIAVPSISLQMARAELNQGARDVTSTLRRVRAQAVNEQVPRYVDLNLSTRMQVYFCEPNADFTDCTWQPEGIPVPLPRSVRVAPGSGFPALANTPVSGRSVPAGAAYFSSTGGYPFASGATGDVYQITISSVRGSTTRTVNFARNTGHTRLEGF